MPKLSVCLHCKYIGEMQHIRHSILLCPRCLRENIQWMSEGYYRVFDSADTDMLIKEFQLWVDKRNTIG